MKVQDSVTRPSACLLPKLMEPTPSTTTMSIVSMATQKLSLLSSKILHDLNRILNKLVEKRRDRFEECISIKYASLCRNNIKPFSRDYTNNIRYPTSFFSLALQIILPDSSIGQS